MIIEGRKLTAFDAMEAAINLSEMYIVRNSKKSVNFRYSHGMDIGKNTIMFLPAISQYILMTQYPQETLLPNCLITLAKKRKC